MKKILLFLSIFTLASLGVQAQRVALTFNFSSFDIDNVSAGTTSIDYKGSTSLTGNLRIFSKKKWALRVGAGVDNLEYTVSDGISTNYSAVRQDLKGVLGVEKHLMLGRRLDIYPGVYIPIILTGDDVIQDSYDELTGGQLRSGLGVLLGANVRFLKIFRLGVEFDASYDHFSEAVGESFNSRSLVPVRGINHTTAFTLGVAF